MNLLLNMKDINKILAKTHFKCKYKKKVWKKTYFWSLREKSSLCFFASVMSPALAGSYSSTSGPSPHSFMLLALAVDFKGFFLESLTTPVIDFSRGPVAHRQWKLIRTSDFCQIFSIESIQIF